MKPPYPRFFVRDAGTDVQKTAKAETPDEAAQYTPERGWEEYGSLLAGWRYETPQTGHTLGFSAEGDDRDTRTEP
jgi:hypothetical protein